MCVVVVVVVVLWVGHSGLDPVQSDAAHMRLGVDTAFYGREKTKRMYRERSAEYRYMLKWFEVVYIYIYSEI